MDHEGLMFDEYLTLTCRYVSRNITRVNNYKDVSA